MYLVSKSFLDEHQSNIDRVGWPQALGCKYCVCVRYRAIIDSTASLSVLKGVPQGNNIVVD